MQKILLFSSREEIDKIIPPGTKRLVKVGSQEICLVHVLQGGFVAFENECPHFGAALHSGHLNNQNEIICPWHSYRFNLSTGEETSSRCSSLKFMPIIEEGEKVYLVN